MNDKIGNSDRPLNFPPPLRPISYLSPLSSSTISLQLTDLFDTNMAGLAPSKVYQDDFHPGKGNALQACAASIFNLTLEEVPNFIEMPGGYEDEMQTFCRSRGLVMEKVALGKDTNENVLGPEYNGKYCILRGTSPRGDHGHVVVAQFDIDIEDFAMIHDPHPDHTFLDESKDYGWAMFFF